MAKQKTRITVESKVELRRNNSNGSSLPKSAAFLERMPPAVRHMVAQTVDLRLFRENVQDLSINDRLTLLEQASILIEQNYVHLPLKSAMHAVNPIQQLKLLKDRITNINGKSEMTDQEFHRELLSIFLSLRDLHTNYVLPAPYNHMIAFVPFLIEEFFEDGQRRYLVSRLIQRFNEPPFAPGVEVLSWNGIQIGRAVEINGNRFAGSNEDARRARGVETMTVRSLSGSLPPDEDHVVVEYRTLAGDVHELRVDWMVFSPGASDASMSTLSPDLAALMAMDEELQRVREARKILFVPEVVTAANEAAAQADADPTLLGLTSYLPDTIEARQVSTSFGTFGYIRVRSFFANIPDFLGRFMDEFIRLLAQLPRQGLIIDVRGNGGGIILAGEMLLQLLTPEQITPEPAQFLNSTLNLRMAEHNYFLQPWASSIRQAIRSGATFSRGFPITSLEEANSIGQIYHGPIVLITDALCYSTTDIFAAGFQDHNIGPILGVDGNTGAGGANVFSHSDILRYFFPESVEGSPYRKLPNGANMRVAIRRTVRVRSRAGDPVEDFGVHPDHRHFMTRNDLLNSNQDLIEKAGELLSGLPIRQLDVTLDRDENNQFLLNVTTKGIARLDIYVDNRPLGSVAVQDGETELIVPDESANKLRLEGFDNSKLVASRLVNIS